MDLTASILSATGTQTSEGHPPDGIDILQALRGDAGPVERDLYWRIDRPDRQQRAIRSGSWKLLEDAGSLLLFDLARDPGERLDLAAQHPEVVRRLRVMLDRWEADVDAGR
jgi:arylsulfatase A-like enzyme